MLSNGMVNFISHNLMQLPLLPLRAVVASQVRFLNLHEYQSKQLMAKHNINVQRFAIAETVEQAENAALGLSTYGMGWDGMQSCEFVLCPTPRRSRKKNALQFMSATVRAVWGTGSSHFEFHA